MQGKVINAIESPDGDKRKTPTRKRKKTCGICGKVLSIYNDNKYCFVHTMKGFEKEAKERDAKKFASYRKHLKKMKKKK